MFFGKNFQEFELGDGWVFILTQFRSCMLDTSKLGLMQCMEFECMVNSNK